MTFASCQEEVNFGFDNRDQRRSNSVKNLPSWQVLYRVSMPGIDAGKFGAARLIRADVGELQVEGKPAVLAGQVQQVKHHL